MGFSTSAAIAVLLCMTLSINAQQASKLSAQQTPKLDGERSAEAERSRPLRPFPWRPSSSSNFNLNSNKNNNDNFIWSSLFAELLSNQNIQMPVSCDEDDEPCFWRMIGAGRLAKSAETAEENQDDVAASDDGTESANLGKSSDDVKRSGRHPFTGSSNFNFNSNKNGNSNSDFVSLFASLQQFLRNQRNLTKKTSTV